MNRDQITPGRTYEKWAESLAIFGGAGAIIYPPVFYYISYVIIDAKEEFYLCTFTKTAEAEAKGETVTDNIRSAIGVNCISTRLSASLVYHSKYDWKQIANCSQHQLVSDPFVIH